MHPIYILLFSQSQQLSAVAVPGQNRPKIADSGNQTKITNYLASVAPPSSNLTDAVSVTTRYRSVVNSSQKVTIAGKMEPNIHVFSTLIMLTLQNTYYSSSIFMWIHNSFTHFSSLADPDGNDVTLRPIAELRILHYLHSHVKCCLYLRNKHSLFSWVELTTLVVPTA